MAAAGQLSRPDLESQLVSTEDLPDHVVEYDRPINDGAFADSPLLNLYEETFIVGGRERRLYRPNLDHGISVQVIEYKAERLAKNQLPSRPAGYRRVAVAGAPESVQAFHDPGTAFVKVLGTKGRSTLEMDIQAVADPFAPPELDQSYLAEVVTTQFLKLQPLPDEPYERSRSTAPILNLMAADSASGLLGVLLLLAIYQSLRDPATWERSLARLGTRKSPPAHAVDISSAARRRSRSHALMSALRILGLAVAVFLLTILPGKRVQSAALAAGMILAAAAIDSLIRRVRGRPRVYTGWTMVPGLALTALAAFLAGLALGQLHLASAPATGNPGFSVERLEGTLRLFRVSAYLLLLLSLIPIRLARSLAMRRLGQRIDGHAGGSVLLLRSFADDALRIRTRGTGGRTVVDRLSFRRWNRFEELVAWTAGRDMRVVALSEPGRRGAKLGAVRQSFSNIDWQNELPLMMEAASAIVVVLGRTESLGWEIGQLRARGLLARTIFVLPPGKTVERRLRLRALAWWLGTESSALDRDAFGSRVLVVGVDAKFSPTIYLSTAPDDLSYEIAISQALENLGKPAKAEAESVEPPPLVADGPLVLAAGSKKRKRQWFLRPSLAMILVWPIVTSGLAAIDQVLGNIPNTDRILTGTVEGMVETTNGTVVVAIDGALVEVKADKPPREIGDYDGRAVQILANSEILVVLTRGGWQVTSYDLQSAKMLWTTELPGRVTGTTITEESLFVVVGQEHLVRSFDPAAGSVTASLTTAEVPWGVVYTEGRLALSFVSSSAVELMDPSLKGERERVVVSGPMWDLVLFDGRPFGVSTQAGTIEAIGTSRIDDFFCLPYYKTAENLRSVLSCHYLF